MALFLCLFSLRNSHFVETNILHHSPNNAETARLCGKGINLIGSLPNIAEEAFDRIRRLNMPIHTRWKGIKRQQMLLIFHQAANRFRIPLPILRLERSELGKSLFFLL